MGARLEPCTVYRYCANLCAKPPTEFRSDDDPLPGALEEDLLEWVGMVAAGEAGINNALTDLEPRAAYALWRQ